MIPQILTCLCRSPHLSGLPQGADKARPEPTSADGKHTTARAVRLLIGTLTIVNAATKYLTKSTRHFAAQDQCAEKDTTTNRSIENASSTAAVKEDGAIRLPTLKKTLRVLAAELRERWKMSRDVWKTGGCPISRHGLRRRRWTHEACRRDGSSGTQFLCRESAPNACSSGTYLSYVC